MSTVTIIDLDRATDVPAEVTASSFLIEPAAVEQATGWELRPEGLCRGDVCVPVFDRVALVSDGLVDLAGLARALRRPLAIEPEAGFAVLGEATDETAEPGLDAPTFTLPDLDGNPVSLADFPAKKKLLVAWASW
jgi:hypothetical protein